jgi:hypothetical protein
MPGEGGKRLQGTGLLNIAGEKIEHSGTLGHPIEFFQAGDCHLPFIYDKIWDVTMKGGSLCAV